MMEFKSYRKKKGVHARPYEPGENLDGITVSDHARFRGSPKLGDMIARDPADHTDQWLIEASVFADTYDTEGTSA